LQCDISNPKHKSKVSGSTPPNYLACLIAAAHSVTSSCPRYTSPL
jgi:hypothetical protein